METIVAWQLVVVASIAVSRIFSTTAMIAVALFWTAWTFLAIWAGELVALQLGTAWGTVWLLSSLFGRAGAKPRPAVDPETEINGKHAPSVSLAVSIPERAVNGATFIIAKEPKVRPITTPVQSIVTSLLNGVTTLAGATTTGLEGLNKALDGINDSMQRQSANMAVNHEILQQLYGLQLSIETILKIVEKNRETRQELTANPRLAEIHARLKARLDEASSEKVAKRRLELRTVTAAPKRPEELPQLAASERVQELTNCLRLVETTITRVASDRDLLQEVEDVTGAPFLHLLVNQQKLLRQHLEFLSPRDPLGQNRIVVKSRGADDPSLPESVNSGSQTTSLLGGHQPPHSENNIRTIQTALEKQDIGQGNVALTNADQGGFLEGALAPVAIERCDRKDIENFARELGIPHLVHFTRCENLAGILRHGLVSIATCDKEGLAFVRNDNDRLDGQPDGISLSIAFPNYRMFYKYRRNLRDADWAVLLISPRVMWEKDCAFYRYNAADARVSREQRDKMKSLQAFRDMFAEDEGTREAWLRPFDPSDPQAEILVYETIPHSYIEAVAFETQEVRTKYMEALGGLESLYAGPGRGLFGARSRARSN